MKPFKIILADDHDIVRAGLRSILDKEKSLQVVAEARDGLELLSALKKNACDLAIVDISMPNMDGLEAIKKIHTAFPKLKIIAFSFLKDYDHFREAIRLGASGYLLKDDVCDDVIVAIQSVLSNKTYVSSSVTTMLAEKNIRSIDDGQMPSLEILTKREREVLVLIAKGFENKNIASKLFISIRTVEHHRANLSDKLGFKNTAALVSYAIAKGIV
jgi:two-component system, NarL family, response regulator NreC